MGIGMEYYLLLVGGCDIVSYPLPPLTIDNPSWLYARAPCLPPNKKQIRGTEKSGWGCRATHRLLLQHDLFLFVQVLTALVDLLYHEGNCVIPPLTIDNPPWLACACCLAATPPPPPHPTKSKYVGLRRVHGAVGLLTVCCCSMTSFCLSRFWLLWLICSSMRAICSSRCCCCCCTCCCCWTWGCQGADWMDCWVITSWMIACCWASFSFCCCMAASERKMIIQWNLFITRSLGPWKLPCYIRFLIISG